MSAIDLGSLDEPARRRADVLDGPKVRLRNGQYWTLARPKVVYEVLTGAAGALTMPRLSFGRGWCPGDVAEAFEREFFTTAGDFKAPPGMPDVGCYFLLLAPLASLLLVRNYRLTIEEREGLLVPVAGDPLGPADLMMRDVGLAALGPLTAVARVAQGLPYDGRFGAEAN